MSFDGRPLGEISPAEGGRSAEATDQSSQAAPQSKAIPMRTRKAKKKLTATPSVSKEEAIAEEAPRSPVHQPQHLEPQDSLSKPLVPSPKPSPKPSPAPKPKLAKKPAAPSKPPVAPRRK